MSIYLNIIVTKRKESVSEFNTVFKLSITSESCTATVVIIILLFCILAPSVHAVSVHLQTFKDHF